MKSAGEVPEGNKVNAFSMTDLTGPDMSVVVTKSHQLTLLDLSTTVRMLLLLTDTVEVDGLAMQIGRVRVDGRCLVQTSQCSQVHP